jgi:uncharacterized cupredoxin-like copper-binding protein
VLSLVAGLSPSHKAGLAVVAGVFVIFAVSAALLIPSRWPGFPGTGLRPFLAATVALFVGMMLAVFFLAREPKEGEAKVGDALHIAQVSEVDYVIKLPATTGERGEYTFDVTNDGKDMHNLAVKGPGVMKKTATLQPGGTAALQVDLVPGVYELYCAVPGHKALGMDTKFTVS